MSLLKQLLISVSLVVLIILGGTVWVNSSSAQEYLNTQLQHQTDSAATALALALAQPSNQNPIAQKRVTTALFDSGQFKRIQLTSSEGASQILHEVRASQALPDVPQWFMRWVPIVAAESSAPINDGPRQIGLITLQADANYAWASLWQGLSRLAVMILVVGIAWALYVFYLIRRLRRVLHSEVTQPLHTLSHDTEAAVAPLKKATFAELSEVTRALASVRQSIAATTEEQSAKIESLEIELNQDAVTGLVNRKYFINELRRLLENQNAQGGWLLLFRQRDLADINKVMTRANVDEWLLSLSQQLQDVIDQSDLTAPITLARLNGSDFVLLVPDPDTNVLQELTQSVQAILRQQRIELPHGEYCRWALAQTDYKPGQFLTHVLGRLDQALMRAESAGHGSIEVLTASQVEDLVDHPKGGETQWRTLLQDALIERRLSLELTALEGAASNWKKAALVLHTSTVTGEKLQGYQFMPVATRLGLSAMCDVRAFELALQHLDHCASDRLILRVSLSSITQAGFIDQIAAQLATISLQLAERLAIELDAYSLTSEPVQVGAFCHMLAQHNVHRGVRRILMLPRVALMLRDLHISYVHVGASDWLELERKTGGLFMLRSTLEVCRALGVLFVFDGDLTLLSESSRQMLQEYGKLTSSPT